MSLSQPIVRSRADPKTFGAHNLCWIAWIHTDATYFISRTECSQVSQVVTVTTTDVVQQAVRALCCKRVSQEEASCISKTAENQRARFDDAESIWQASDADTRQTKTCRNLWHFDTFCGFVFEDMRVVRLAPRTGSPIPPFSQLVIQEISKQQRDAKRCKELYSYYLDLDGGHS